MREHFLRFKKIEGDESLLLLDYFERRGHDNHRGLCRVYQWEEKKTKAAWGGTTVKYRTIGEKPFAV